MQSIVCLLYLGKNDWKAHNEVQKCKMQFDATCLDWEIWILIGQVLTPQPLVQPQMQWDIALASQSFSRLADGHKMA
jgi:hypothetical protein